MIAPAMINSVESVQKPLFSPRVYEKELVAEAEELKNEITKGLRNSIRSVERDTKSHYRNVHSHSRLVALGKHKAWIEKNWPKYNNFLAEPREIKPSAIQPRLELVEKQSQRDIFRIARLFWSLPYKFHHLLKQELQKFYHQIYQPIAEHIVELVLLL
jgi:hypothetical protein